MGFRKTGKTKIIEKKETECFCDVCEKTIDLDKYPQFELKIERFEPSHYLDDDSAPYLDICSPECLIKKAQQLIKKKVKGEL